MPKSRVCSICDATGSHENILSFSVRKLKYYSTQKDYYDLRILGKWVALERGKIMSCQSNYSNGNRRKGERRGVRKYRIAASKGKKRRKRKKGPWIKSNSVRSSDQQKYKRDIRREDSARLLVKGIQENKRNKIFQNTSQRAH